jgi:hypothetical protein
MSFLIIFLVVMAVLFVLAYMTKRRFGVLGLALAAGAMISTLWVGDLTPIIASAGLVLVQPPLESVVSAGLILLPAILLLFSGPVYKGKVQRIVGALAFTVLATALLLPPLGSALVIDDTAKPIYEAFFQYRPVIITVALIYALGDLLVTKTPKHRGQQH